LISRDYISTKRPTKSQIEIVSLLVKLYVPNYFQIKSHSHIQQGALNLFAVIEYSRQLVPGSRATVERVLQDNSFFGHPENIAIAMLADEREEVRRQAVLYIRSFHFQLMPKLSKQDQRAGTARPVTFNLSPVT
jgi:hypothetical protein